MKSLVDAIKYIAICLLVGLLGSCAEDKNSLCSTGILYLNVEEDATLHTKAQTGVTFESLRVDVLDMNRDTVNTYKDYLSDVKDQRMTLPVGKYIVAVSSNHTGEAGWETPLYRGEEEVEVKQGEITSAQVVCKITNTKVSVLYSENMKNYFSHYGTTVSNSSGSLTFTRDEYRSGYFTPEELTMSLKLVNRDGNEFVIRKIYPDINPQYHYIFNIAIANPGGGDQEAGADFDVTIDEEHDEITYDIFVRKEDLFRVGITSFSLSDNFTNGVFSFRENAETMPQIGLTYKVGTKTQFQKVLVETTSPVFVEAGLSKFDLTDPQSATSAQALGLGNPPTPDLGESADFVDCTWDLSGLLSYLKAVNDKPTEHLFKVLFVDDRNQEKETSFTIKIMPDVAAAVEDPICWTTFAVLRGITVDKTAYFQLTSSDGLNIDIKDVERTDEGNVSALVTGLKPDVSYSYKLASEQDPAMVCGAVEFKVEAASVVPNLGFEEWGTRVGKVDAPGSYGGNKTYISPNDDSKNIYWESGNLGATAGKTVLTNETEEVASINSSKKAAYLVSTWAGVNLTVTKIGAFSAGSIFSGIVEYAGQDGAELLYGQSYKGFPVSLNGWYKYKPGTINWKNNAETTSSELDKGIICIALSTQKISVKSLTKEADSEKNKFRKNSEGIFAYGEMEITENVDTYTEFSIPLTYYKGKMPSPETPIYIIIMASSSKDGDVFTGSTSSVMYVDEFSLSYDYNQECLKETEYKDIPVNPVNNE
ncbi:DUF4493 domain-containing protein [uncultured Parabacteroides sp.]|uniref:DUF4493 domain-containing protein n=1 Tax=uncultured Parabacteroides sp. TaxID=512312 RepID=UPI002627F89F|nr:DUF4493 domain-containing protein [uncultured Parabacteroides sp.]